MADISSETIEQVARLARLTLSEEEVESFRKEFRSIIDAFSVLDEVDTEGVEPAFHPIPIDREPREDIPEDSLSQEEALANSENREDDYFKGPRAV